MAIQLSLESNPDTSFVESFTQKKGEEEARVGALWDSVCNRCLSHIVNIEGAPTARTMIGVLACLNKPTHSKILALVSAYFLDPDPSDNTKRDIRDICPNLKVCNFHRKDCNSEQSNCKYSLREFNRLKLIAGYRNLGNFVEGDEGFVVFFMCPTNNNLECWESRLEKEYGYPITFVSQEIFNNNPTEVRSRINKALKRQGRDSTPYVALITANVINHRLFFRQGRTSQDVSEATMAEIKDFPTLLEQLALRCSLGPHDDLDEGFDRPSDCFFTYYEGSGKEHPIQVGIHNNSEGFNSIQFTEYPFREGVSAGSAFFGRRDIS